MELRQLRHFVALANATSFRRAADELHIAQPALSTSIRRLEEELNTELFTRSRRGIRLTQSGAMLLDDAQKTLLHAQRVRQTAGRAASGMIGVLKVAFVGSATYNLLPTLLPPFRARYPGITIELTEGTTSVILDAVARTQIDIGLIRTPVLEPHKVQLMTVESDTLIAAVPNGNALQNHETLKLADLAGEEFVMYSKKLAPNLRAQVTLACQRAGFLPRVVQEATQIQTMVSLVESGLGVALVPSACQRFSAHRATFNKIQALAGSLDVAIAAAWLPDAGVETARHFMEYVAEWVNKDDQPVPECNLMF